MRQTGCITWPMGKLRISGNLRTFKGLCRVLALELINRSGFTWPKL